MHKAKLKLFPKKHLIAAGGIAALIGLSAVIPFTGSHGAKVNSAPSVGLKPHTPATDVVADQAVTASVSLADGKPALQLPPVDWYQASKAAASTTPDSVTHSAAEQETIRKAVAVAALQDSDASPAQVDSAVSGPHMKTIRVVKGDSLSTVFSKAGLSATTLHAVIDNNKQARSLLLKLDIGQELEFTLGSSEDQLLQLKSKLNKLETVVLSRTESGYQLQHETVDPKVKENYARGIIDSSLFIAAQRAGLSHKMIMQLADAFGYDIDFALDLRKGDTFEAIFEEKMVDGKRVSTGELLAARFVNRGKEYTAVRYTPKGGVSSYYRADGTSMKRAFIRTPVDFTRISSRFSNGRRHPILNRLRAHKGVDYAAPTGTPIRASGNGRIVEIGRKGGYGNAIVLQHGKTYSTLYGHMSRFSAGLKRGDTVKQGQTIGFVGMTGLATGPHLHYEFRVNNVHVDPLSVKLPTADPISGAERKTFLAVSRPLMARMDKERDGTMVASRH